MVSVLDLCLMGVSLGFSSLSYILILQSHWLFGSLLAPYLYVHVQSSCLYDTSHCFPGSRPHLLWPHNAKSVSCPPRKPCWWTIIPKAPSFFWIRLLGAVPERNRLLDPKEWNNYIYYQVSENIWDQKARWGVLYLNLLKSD